MIIIISELINYQLDIKFSYLHDLVCMIPDYLVQINRLQPKTYFFKTPFIIHPKIYF